MVPSDEEVIARQYEYVLISRSRLEVSTLLSSVQVLPESVEIQMFHPEAAASLVPSDDEVIACQDWVLPTLLSSTQVLPESVEIQMFALSAQAAIFVPSEEEVICSQYWVLPTLLSSVQVLPESVEIQMFP